MNTYVFEWSDYATMQKVGQQTRRGESGSNKSAEAPEAFFFLTWSRIYPFRRTRLVFRPSPFVLLVLKSEEAARYRLRCFSNYCRHGPCMWYHSEDGVVSEQAAPAKHDCVRAPQSTLRHVKQSVEDSDQDSEYPEHKFPSTNLLNAAA